MNKRFLSFCLTSAVAFGSCFNGNAMIPLSTKDLQVSEISAIQSEEKNILYSPHLGAVLFDSVAVNTPSTAYNLTDAEIRELVREAVMENTPDCFTNLLRWLVKHYDYEFNIDKETEKAVLFEAIQKRKLNSAHVLLDFYFNYHRGIQNKFSPARDSFPVSPIAEYRRIDQEILDWHSRTRRGVFKALVSEWLLHNDQCTFTCTLEDKTYKMIKFEAVSELAKDITELAHKFNFGKSKLLIYLNENYAFWP